MAKTDANPPLPLFPGEYTLTEIDTSAPVSYTHLPSPRDS